MVFILSSPEFTVAENNKLRFAVLRSGDAEFTEQVNVSTSSGSAKAGADFQSLNRTLIFLPGERQKNIDIDIYGDEEVEIQEIFRIQLLQIPQFYSESDGQLGKPNVAIVKILDVSPIVNAETLTFE